MELHLKVIGTLMVLLAILHLFFSRYFKWKTEFGTVSIINRQMMYIHTFFIGLTVFLMGILCLTSGEELVTTTLGRRICFGLGMFWTVRLYIQFFGYSSKLWKGKSFETTMHILFSFIWIYLSVVFLYISLSIR